MSALIERYCIRVIPIGMYVGKITNKNGTFTVLTGMMEEVETFIDEDDAEGKIRTIVDRNMFGEKEQVLAYEVITIYLQPR